MYNIGSQHCALTGETIGQCSYCGQPAGLLRSSHKECQARHEQAIKTIESTAQQGVLRPCDLGALENQLRNTASSGWVPDAEFRGALVSAAEQALAARDAASGADQPNTLITHQEEAALADFLKQFKLAVQPDLEPRGWAMRIALELTIRGVLEGELPRHFDCAGLPMFNLAAGESVVWAVGGAELLEEKTVRSVAGYYGGPSFRLARGVYWRMGGFRAHPISHTQVVVADRGVAAFGTLNFYFGGAKSDLRVPWAKVVAFHPHSDGFALTKDGVRGKLVPLRTHANGELLCILAQALAQARLGVPQRKTRAKVAAEAEAPPSESHEGDAEP
jgi:hypothetical protein